jgi:hypothetical protein
MFCFCFLSVVCLWNGYSRTIHSLTHSLTRTAYIHIIILSLSLTIIHAHTCNLSLSHLHSYTHTHSPTHNATHTTTLPMQACANYWRKSPVRRRSRRRGLRLQWQWRERAHRIQNATHTHTRREGYPPLQQPPIHSPVKRTLHARSEFSVLWRKSAVVVDPPVFSPVPHCALPSQRRRCVLLIPPLT